MFKALIGLFVPGNFGALAIAGGVIAFLAAGSATLVTSNYYNHLIVDSSTHAAQVSYDLGVKNQKTADANMSVARELLAHAEGERDQGDRDRKAIADAYLAGHKPPDLKACRMPIDVAHAINQALGLTPAAPAGATP